MVILFAVDNCRNFFNATERDESTADLRVMKIQEIITQIKLGHAEYTRACFFLQLKVDHASHDREINGIKMCAIKEKNISI